MAPGTVANCLHTARSLRRPCMWPSRPPRRRLGPHPSHQTHPQARESMCQMAGAAKPHHVAQEPMVKLVHKVLSVYEMRSLEEQRQVLEQLYDKDAIYENNIALLRGRDEIARRFALLPISTKSVKLEYSKPVVLGATTSAPEALNDLAYKGDLQVEVQNTQHYSFDRGHSLWRNLLLPHGDMQLSVLTRLTLSKDQSKVLYHRDIWTKHHDSWWGPLQRCWGVVEQAAGRQAAAHAGSKAS